MKPAVRPPKTTPKREGLDRFGLESNRMHSSFCDKSEQADASAAGIQKQKLEGYGVDSDSSSEDIPLPGMPLR